MRLRSIDFLRGIAVSLVFCRHVPFEPILTFSGWVGVDLFFVLSGFLVSNLLFQEYQKTGNVKPLRFLARRGLKIYPLYYLMIFIFWRVSIYFDPNYAAIHQKHLLVECLFVQNYLPQFMMTNQTWSLAIEEHFYIGLAVLMFILAKMKWLDNKILFNVLSAIIMLLCLNMRKNIVLPVEGFPDFKLFYLPTHLRIDSLWVGVFLSFHFNFSKAAFERIFKRDGWAWLGLLSIGMAMCYIVENKFMATMGITLISLGFGATLASFVADENIDAVLNRVFGKWFINLFARLGTYSYAIYLFHEVFIYYFKPFDDVRFRDYNQYNTYESRINFIVILACTLLVSVLATEFIEKPILKWRNRVLK
jgi:peptidoglycan/LPS O-acetylase OafA/YrhL